MMRPIRRYRPSKSSDGEYGFTETMGPAEKVYGQISWHDTELVLLHRVEEDIDMADIIEAPSGAQYRVVGKTVPVGGGYAQSRIEREDKPVNTE